MTVFVSKSVNERLYRYIQARSEDFKRGGGRDFKCCCVQENFEKLTLSGAFSDHFLRKGGGGRGTSGPPLTA